MAAAIGANVTTTVQMFLYDRDKNPHDHAELQRYLTNLEIHARSGGWDDVLTTTKPAHMPADMHSTLTNSTTGGGTAIEQQAMREKNTVAMQHLRASMIGAQNTALINETKTREWPKGQVWLVLAALHDAVTLPPEDSSVAVDECIMQMTFDKHDDPTWWFNKIAAIESAHSDNVMTANALLAKMRLKLPEVYRLNLIQQTFPTRAAMQKYFRSIYRSSVPRSIIAENEQSGGRRHQSEHGAAFMQVGQVPCEQQQGTAMLQYGQQGGPIMQRPQPLMQPSGGWQTHQFYNGWQSQQPQGGWQGQPVQGWIHGAGMSATGPLQQQQRNGHGNNGQLRFHCTICNSDGHQNTHCWEDPRNAHQRPAGWQSRLTPAQRAQLFPQEGQQQHNQGQQQQANVGQGNTNTIPGGTAVPMVPMFPDIDLDYCVTAVGVSTDFDPATPAAGGESVVSVSEECNEEDDDGSQNGQEEEDKLEAKKMKGAVSKRFSADMLQDPNIFICDTGATSHVTAHDIGFIPHRAATNADATLGFHGVPTKPKSIGAIQGHFLDKDGLPQQQDAFKMEDVKLQPDSKFNLFSASALTQQGWTLGGDQHAFWLEHPETKYRIMFDILVPANHNVLYCTYFQRSEDDSGQVGNQVEQVESVVALVKQQKTDQKIDKVEVSDDGAEEGQIDKVEVSEIGVEEGTGAVSCVDLVNNAGGLKEVEEGTKEGHGQFTPYSLFDETRDEKKKKSATEACKETLVRLGELGFSGCNHKVDKTGRYRKETKEGLVEFLSWIDDATCQQYEGVGKDDEEVD